jgi:hypothetical protein
VAALVVGSAAPVLRGHHHLPLGTEDDPLERVGEVGLLDVLVVASSGQKRCLVDQVGEVGADHAGRRRGDSPEVDVGRERHLARVHPEDRLAARSVRRLHGDAPVEAARPQQRRVEHIGPVRRGDHDHARGRIEAVHLGQDLVQGLLALVVAAAEASHSGRAGAADRVELVDEHDRGSRFLRLFEQVSHARRAHADDRLDELRGGYRVERHVGLARDGPRQQRLPRPGRTGQQDAVRDAAAEPAVLLRVAQEVDHLRQLSLRLFDPGDVGESHAIARRLVALRARAPEGAEDVLDIARAPHQPEEQPDEEDRRAEAQQQGLPPGRAAVEGLCVDDDAVLLEQGRQGVVVREGWNLGPEARRGLRPFVRELLRERALDVRALRGDLLDVLRPHLVEEERAVGDSNA